MPDVSFAFDLVAGSDRSGFGGAYYRRNVGPALHLHSRFPADTNSRR